MKTLKKIGVLAMALALLGSLICPVAAEETVHSIVLSSQETAEGWTHSATLDGEALSEYDYAWHADPTQAHEDVKNSPAEYYTGTEPGDEAVYIAHDIIYYPELDESKFQLANYDGEMEWVYRYEAEGYEDYLFSTLPVLGNSLPTQMMHSEAEAWENAVLHITQPGTYELTGTWHGQIWIDLGDEDDVYADPTQKVTLILNGVDITCTVAPGVVFYSVYECDNAWEDAEDYSHTVDTTDAGANVVLADGSVNNVTGTNIFRILKTKFKDDDSTDAYPAQKKSWKIDGSFYSYMSMNITGQDEGTGVLNITAGFEGLDSEHHLTINGGNVNIYSQDDGINVNEDGVSVLTVNGGNLHICAGLGTEGDGIDSNGFLVVNGGTVITMANPAADSGLDSDFGSFVNGGTVVALGATMDWAESDETSGSTQPVLNLRFGASQSADEAIIITDTQGQVVFAYDPDQDEVTSGNQRTYQGAIISAPGLTMGGSYHIYIGGDVTGTEVSGVYDAATVTAFEGATQQCWSGDSLGGFGGFGDMGGFGGRGDMSGFGDMGGAGMERPEGDRGQMPGMDGNMELPNGDMEMPQGGQNIPGGNGQAGGMTPPEGMELPEGMEGMEGMEMPNGQGFGGMDGMWSFGTSLGATCTYDTEFTLSQQVNGFSGVLDYGHSLTKVEAVEPDYGQKGNLEHYACSGCGKLFADAAGTQEVTAEDVALDSLDYTLLIGALVFCGVALIAAIVVIAVLVLRKKKDKEQK